MISWIHRLPLAFSCFVCLSPSEAATSHFYNLKTQTPAPPSTFVLYGRLREKMSGSEGCREGCVSWGGRECEGLRGTMRPELSARDTLQLTSQTTTTLGAV
ncbi:hypothetical protein BDQ17DRAFT_637642 [Cyathus striatus]|nr:hypothetical protein BDQ17DRAFT_637642 [Cyathus striatus]